MKRLPVFFVMALCASPAWAQVVAQSPATTPPETAAPAEAAAAPATQEQAGNEGGNGAAAPASSAEAVQDGSRPASQVSPQPEVRAGSSELVTPAPPPTTRPRIALGDDTFYIKPILAIAGGLHVENLIQTLNRNRESRATTVALTRFGFEGKLGEYVTFRSEFERNIRAHGSGIWEGTASLSVRDQVVRLSRWGATAEAGIILDPASVDFFSTHMADTLLADKYTRDPLLYSGFNRGQGVQAAVHLERAARGPELHRRQPAEHLVVVPGGWHLRRWQPPLGAAAGQLPHRPAG